MSGIGSSLPTIHADSPEEKHITETEAPAEYASGERRGAPAFTAPPREPRREKVQAGQGFKGEDCVEEMFHVVHCKCVAPQVFPKLR
ncbi:hypothetical protein B0H17DRAFT_1202706 [Mycena rosella]|uniref:Ubiquinol-cytochrome C reductase hinge domain-containing protein n=1 Tax=Mycena rosella TaxID=1033263 RepID=A0AAD7DDM0_MYCRO|nr:hypothetical protein B0H17DRAFT_1202706 [Mycena rosella]